MPTFETLPYEGADGVAWVTLDRPERHDACNGTLTRELNGPRRDLRCNDAVRPAAPDGCRRPGLLHGGHRLAAAAAVEGTVRALWAAQELGRRGALSMAPALVTLGNQPEAIAEGQSAFTSGRRMEPRIR